MRRSRLFSWSLCLLVAAVLMPGTATAQEAGLNHIEAEYCAGCHSNPGMAETVAQWAVSEHGQSFDWGSGANTYCASCKSPPDWDPAATRDDNQPIAAEDWQDLTCGGCHPPHSLRVAWGTPIGVIVDPTAADPSEAWMPLYDNNELCVHCHSGSRHQVDFQGFGKVMFEKKNVACVDCHMANVANSSPDGLGESHTWQVAATLPASCGVGDDACHANKTSTWALKQIEKHKIHGKK